MNDRARSPDSVEVRCDPLVEMIDLGGAPPPTDWAGRRLYVGEEGARNWLDVVGESSFAEHAHAPYGLRPFCLDAVARVRAGTIVSLGPGDGAFDLELVRVLQRNEPALAYIPVEISRKLLETTIDRLGGHVPIPVGILADFERGRPFFRDVLDRFARRPIVFSLLGGTVANLDLGEPHFFGDMKELMQPGDSFLLDAPLAGPSWTAEDDPRLDPSQYTDPLKRLLAGGLADRGSVREAGAGADWFEERIERIVDVGGAIEKTKLFTIRDRQSRQVVLRIRLYDWDSLNDWFRHEGFEISFARCSLSSPEDKLGMGAVLLTKQGERE